jgi:hypothetical protein
VTRDKISKSINWHIIQDIKDMSLEYIDDGYMLRLVVIMTTPAENGGVNLFAVVNKEYSYPVYLLWYDHDQSDEEYDYVTRFDKGDIDISKIVYRVNIFPKNGDYNSDLSSELASRVMSAYPEINVII